ncbi:uncharacterized protein F5147DRAFT_772165 [Suillus discolor]|uniref:Uncharacterized protein n=1 Tax=Suillus discolor TaxID=1912936 RepID=A0A9P7JVL1_9AGAM|nr:uncharacterized protein F5147DRAFT_772165 [Suillus discolor]KAG2110897.1 hypothetical protein F5147DRAFT_772165 [Suillus discolor]
MAAIFGSSTGSSPYYYTRARKAEVKTKEDTKMASKPSTTTAWLKYNSTSKSKVQSLGPTSKPALSNQADIVTTSCKPKEAEHLTTESLVNSLNNVIVSIGKCADTIIDALQHIQVEPMCFSNVSFHEFVTMLDSISGNDTHFLKANEISSAISSEPHSLSFMRSLLMVNVIPGCIYSEDIFTIPNMQLTLTPTTSEAAETEVLWYMETIFSQSKCVALKKIEKVLVTHCKIICILFILISEQTHYETPSEDSPTYSQALADKSLCPYTSFSPHRDGDKLFDPVKAMGHDWINVSKVEYFVWLKEDDNVININDPHMAYGVASTSTTMSTLVKNNNTKARVMGDGDASPEPELMMDVKIHDSDIRHFAQLGFALPVKALTKQHGFHGDAIQNVYMQLNGYAEAIEVIKEMRDAAEELL